MIGNILMTVWLKTPNTVNYGRGVLAQIEKSVIVALGVSEFLKISLVPFSINERKFKPKQK